MLVPLTQVIGTGYNAGLTATTLAFQPDAYAGGGFTSPSGRPVGGLKLGKDVAYRMVATAQNNRYRNGPPALGCASEINPVMKDRSVPYFTEREQQSRFSGLGADEAVDLGPLVAEQKKSLPWALLGILALIMAWPAFRPQYRRGLSA